VGRFSKRNPGYLLIADSNVNDLYSLSMLLQRLNYNVCTATTGSNAFELAIAAVPELIITALDLTDLPGAELVHRLKGDSRTSNIPLIVINDAPAFELEQQCRKAGVVDFMINPIPAEVLFRSIQKTIEQTPRENIRIRTRLSISINNKILDCEKGECITELSEYGMYVRTLEPCPQRTRIAIRFELGGRSISGEAETLYCHRFGEGPFKEPGMGLKLVTLSAGDRNYIKTYIREEIMKSIP
jgi:response regulator RpfG family c-di-GMP phosphodiesterase